MCLGEGNGTLLTIVTKNNSRGESGDSAAPDPTPGTRGTQTKDFYRNRQRRFSTVAVPCGPKKKKNNPFCNACSRYHHTRDLCIGSTSTKPDGFSLGGGGRALRASLSGTFLLEEGCRDPVLRVGLRASFSGTFLVEEGCRKPVLGICLRTSLSGTCLLEEGCRKPVHGV